MSASSPSGSSQNPVFIDLTSEPDQDPNKNPIKNPIDVVFVVRDPSLSVFFRPVDKNGSALLLHDEIVLLEDVFCVFYSQIIPVRVENCDLLDEEEARCAAVRLATTGRNTVHDAASPPVYFLYYSGRVLWSPAKLNNFTLFAKTFVELTVDFRGEVAFEPRWGAERADPPLALAFEGPNFLIYKH